jgi:hypothetical protein
LAIWLCVRRGERKEGKYGCWWWCYWRRGLNLLWSLILLV